MEDRNYQDNQVATFYAHHHHLMFITITFYELESSEKRQRKSYITGYKLKIMGRATYILGIKSTEFLLWHISSLG